MIDQRLEALGATRAAPRLDCDLDYEAAAATWLGQTLPALRGPTADEGSVIHVDFGGTAATVSKSNPFAAEITALSNLNSSRSAKQTFHVELSLAGSGITYRPGDAIGVVPQNDPALVDLLLQATGLEADDAVRTALTARHDVTTLTGHLVRTLAATAGDARLSALAADGDALNAMFQAGTSSTSFRTTRSGLPRNSFCPYYGRSRHGYIPSRRANSRHRTRHICWSAPCAIWPTGATARALPRPGWPIAARSAALPRST